MNPVALIIAEPCASDRYYDALGQSAPYRRCHDTADLIFACTGSTGVPARIYQGGFMRANDIECMKEIRIL
jgi:hypothetical protein